MQRMADKKLEGNAPEDDLSGRKREYRAARIAGNQPGGNPNTGRPVPSDDAQVASEAMVLERLPEGMDPPPPGRQRTGDPPAV